MAPLLDMVSALREQGAALNPPASREDLSALEEAIKGPLPPEVRTLYESHDGQPHCLDAEGSETGQLSRLITIEELLQALKDIAEEYPDLDDISRQFLPLWTDGSDYDVLFIEEPLRGRVAYSSHELGGLVLRPKFRNVASYYAVIICQMVHRNDDLCGAFFFSSGPLHEYPARRPFPETDPDDEIAFRHCLERYAAARDESRRLYYGFNAAYLCPYLRADEILPLLDDSDHHFVNEVCKVLGRRNWPGAVSALGRTALRSGSWGGAIDALTQITDPRAEQELLRIASHLSSNPPGDVTFIAEALRARGYEVRKSEEAKYSLGGFGSMISPDRYQFRRTRDTVWRDLGSPPSG